MGTWKRHTRVEEDGGVASGADGASRLHTSLN